MNQLFDIAQKLGFVVLGLVILDKFTAPTMKPVTAAEPQRLVLKTPVNKL